MQRMRMSLEERRVLEQLYVSHAIPTDRLPQHPEILRAMAVSFEQRAQRRVESGELLRYMVSRRKHKDWPKLGAQTEQLQSASHLLTPDQVDELHGAFDRIGHGVDEYLFSHELLERLATHFQSTTGVQVKGEVLLAVMLAKRKRGLWSRGGDIAAVHGIDH